MKRVYKTVGVQADRGGFGVRLDGRELKSPGKNPMILPTRALAQAIAEEWDAQGDEIRPHAMPLMQIASTAVDVVAVKRAEIVDGVVAYAGTDLTCYRADHPRELAERQAELWQPHLDWVMVRFDAPLHVQAGLMPHPQPESSLRALRAAVDAYDLWTLCALQIATAACGSLVLALALVEGRVSSDEAFDASQLDETFQIEKWGEDPEATKRRVALNRDIAAAKRFLDLLRTE